MSDKQKWEERYLTQDIPWEGSAHHPKTEQLFLKYIPAEKSVLDVGCGKGMNARWLANAGYVVTAIDISPEAIRLAKQENNSIHFIAMDFLEHSSQLPIFNAVFDCAVLQVLKEEQRTLFSKKMADHCEQDGYWINISCSKDQAEFIAKQTGVKAPPYLTAEKIIKVAEPWFEIIEMQSCEFTIHRKESGTATFHAWGSVFKKR
jgi:2-polyprenyl-3-methyl-5-hydroxy-6-metoxy-1,4-benzoquinol methylase